MSSVQPASRRQQYDDWAKTYDADTAAKGWVAPERIQNLALQRVAANSSARVLDVGVGTGLSCSQYLNQGAQVVGIDLSVEMLKEASEGHAYAGLFSQDINETFVDLGEPFDVALSSGTLHFSKDLEHTFSEIARFVRPGGYFVFSLIPPQARQFGPGTTVRSDDDVRSALESAGFELIEKPEEFVAYYNDGADIGNDPVKYRSYIAQLKTTSVDMFCESAQPQT